MLVTRAICSVRDSPVSQFTQVLPLFCTGSPTPWKSFGQRKLEQVVTQAVEEQVCTVDCAVCEKVPIMN